MALKTTLTLEKRSSGILLHPTSLPGPHGIGDLGQTAYNFVDFLKSSGQTNWQMFPLGPLSWGNSPYQTLSAFAGSSLLISLEKLVEEKLLSKHEIKQPSDLSTEQVIYEKVHSFKNECLILAHDRFTHSHSNSLTKAYGQFCRKNKVWLDDYSLYRAIKNHFNGAPWWQWDKDVRNRKQKALKSYARQLSQEINFHKFCQFLFYRQWDELHRYAHAKGISLIGDIPIFVAHDSAAVWAHPTIFSLEKDGRIKFVAGVPPDYFSKTGQLWGNPVYRWDVLKKQKYGWWIRRLEKAFEMFDVIRLDHFIGFERYWAVPGDAPTAETGSWKKGPGANFFKTVLKKIPKAQIIAEDLGSITPEVISLRKKFGFPGMRVLQFSFETHKGAEVNRPYNFSQKSVVYTGTHDNDTTVGWFNNLSPNGNGERAMVLKYTNSSGKEIHWDLIRLALMSRANTVIVPMQDVLGLGSEARINRPGSTEGNWEWRLSEKDLTPEISKRLFDLTHLYNRI